MPGPEPPDDYEFDVSAEEYHAAMEDIAPELRAEAEAVRRGANYGDPDAPGTGEVRVGDAVNAREGVGVVVAALETDRDADDPLGPVEASPETPAYAVVVKDPDVPLDTYREDELTPSALLPDSVDPLALAGEEELSAMATGAVDVPPAWEASAVSVPALALRALADTGATPAACRRVADEYGLDGEAFRDRLFALLGASPAELRALPPAEE